MGEVIGNAVGVAISPLPVVALVLVLMGERARVGGVAFLAGWALGLAALGAVVLLLGPSGEAGSEPSAVLVGVRLMVGVLFLLLAVRQWRGRPVAGEEPAVPGWMATIGTLGAARVLGTAAALAAVNPKNLGLTVAAAVDISSHGLSAPAQAGVLAVFVVLGSVTVLAAVGYLLVAGERATPVLATLRAWLAAHGWIVMTVLFVVLGSRLVGAGLSALGA